MQKDLASLICALALLAVLVPATIADESQNATENITLNKTQNLTGNITLNATDNFTAPVTSVEDLNVTEGISANDSQKGVPTATQMGAGKASSHTKVLRAGFEKTKAPKQPGCVRQQVHLQYTFQHIFKFRIQCQPAPGKCIPIHL